MLILSFGPPDEETVYTPAGKNVRAFAFRAILDQNIRIVFSLFVEYFLRRLRVLARFTGIPGKTR
jgi:hypothetical protein